jgi:hypothetical protein
MKTNDKIREEAIEYCEKHDVNPNESVKTKFRHVATTQKHFLTDFTHSQLKEQQEEINYLKSECDRLNLLEEVRYDEHGNVVEFPLSMYYTPDFGCQKYPQESYESDLEQYEQSKTAQQLIKELKAENERLKSKIGQKIESHQMIELKLQSKQKEVDDLREGIKIANQRVQSGAWDLDNLDDYIEELIKQ